MLEALLMNLVAGAGLGYEPDELPDCSIPRYNIILFVNYVEVVPRTGIEPVRL